MNLKRFRKTHGLTQTQLATQLSKYAFFCRQPFISAVEKSVRKPPYEMMEAFKMAFPNALIDSVFFNGIRTSPKNSFATRHARIQSKEEKIEEYKQLFIEVWDK